MIKTVLLTLLTVSILFSRDNPFVPVDKTDTISNNNQKQFYKFKKDEIRLPSSARVIKKFSIVYQNIDGSTDTITKEIEREIDWHEPIIITHKNSESNITTNDNFREIEIGDIKFVKLYHLGQDFKIKTPFKMKKHFFMSKPYRIVMDFEGTVKTEKLERKLKKKFFTKVTISGHDDFFRVVLELDSYYEYVYTRIDGGYMIGVR